MGPDPIPNVFPNVPAGLDRRRHHLLLGLGCVLVLALLASSFWQAAASLQALGKVQAQAERIGRLDSLLIQLADAESSVRGYLLSRNREYLQPYEAGLATIEYTLEDIRSDLATVGADDAPLVDLSALVKQKMQILAKAVARGSVAEEAPKGSGDPEGKRYMDLIRESLNDLKQRELADGQRSIERSASYFHRTRWVVATLAGGALLLLLGLYAVLQGQLKLREQIADLLRNENQRLDALVQERTEELTHLASYLTNAREAEQARLARELHDELGALLTAAKMDASWISRQLDTAPPALQERFKHLQEMLASGILLKRRLIDDLRPPLLKELGLVAALRALAEDFMHSSDTRVELALPDADLEVPPDQALALFRIAQEGLTNIRKHAGARVVKLGLTRESERVILRLEDDGQGFEPAQAGRRRHGLAGMRHRVQMFAGDFSLVSRKGEGTCIVASVPLSGNAAALPNAST